MGDDITIGVTEIVNNIEVTAQPNDQIVDISVIDNADDVTLNITPTVIEINVNKGSSYAKWGTILGTLSDQTDLQNALNLKANLVDGKVPASELPSYVDDIIEVANYSALPTTGETGKIYVTLDNNKIYRWSGSVYIEIAANSAVWGAITGTLSSQTDLQNALNTKVPYTGATGNVNLGEYGLTSGYYQFDTTPTGTPTSLGTMYWDAFYRTVSLIDGDGDTTLQIGQEERILVHNNTGSTLTDGQVVYVTGSTGELPSVSLANASNESTSAATIGVVTESIANGADGFITTSGLIHGLNTLAFTEGDLLWLGTTAGTYTNTKPTSPNHLVLIGYVIKKAGGNGSILVKIQNTQELEESSDVLFSGLTNNDVLTWESATSLWKNKSIATILGYTPANDANVVHLTGNESIGGIKTFTGSSIILDNSSGTTISTFKGTGTTVAEFIFNSSFTQFKSVASGGYLFKNSASANSLSISDSGNGTFLGSVTASSIIKNGGTSSQFLKADGSVDSTSYQPLLTNPITGSGTTNYIPKFTGANSLGNSSIQDSDSLVTITNATKFIGLNTIQGTTASDTAPLGSELAAVTGTGTNWTLAGTNLNVGGYTHTVGSTTPLTTTLAAVSGTYYQITYTIIGRTAGSITIAYGGTTTSGITATGATGPLTSSTAALIITPTTDFDGTVILSIKSIGTSSATTSFLNSSGTVVNEIRANSSNTNVFIGVNSGRRNTTGVKNTAIGYFSLQNNTTGLNNSALGNGTLLNNTIGSNNSAFGINTLVNNTTGNGNTAFGCSSSYSNTTGSNNSAFGINSLQNNTTGTNNVAFGVASLYSNISGNYNVVFGNNAGRFIADKTTAATILNNSIMLGFQTSPLADNQTNQVVIGHNSTGLGSNTTVLGNSSTTTTAVYGNLLLGTTTDAGYKLDVNGTTRIQSTLSLPSLTTNYLPKIGTSGVVGNSLIYDNGTNVGIGTTSPLSKLHVSFTSDSDGLRIQNSNRGNSYLLATAGGSAEFFSLYDLGSSQFLYFAGNSGHSWNTQGSERMRITSSGNVGIGTTSPNRKLEISTTANGIPLRLQTDGSNTGIEYLGGSSNYNFFVGKQYNVSNAFEITPSTTAGGTTFSNPAFIVNSSGNVGIGTTSPSQKLDVNGTARVSGVMSLPNMAYYADNAAALSAGLTYGDLYYDGNANVKIVINLG